MCGYHCGEDILTGSTWTVYQLFTAPINIFFCSPLQGFELNGLKIAVRYPDRIPHGMGISKSALRADDLQNENMRQVLYIKHRFKRNCLKKFRKHSLS